MANGRRVKARQTLQVSTNAIEMETAEVVNYFVLLGDVVHVDLNRAAKAKRAINEDRHPIQSDMPTI